MEEIKRSIHNQILNVLQNGKIAIIYGARQVGKTTLAKKIGSELSTNSLYLNCDEPDIVQSLSRKTSTELKNLIGQSNVVIIDEAQRVENIGLSLKLLHDTFPDIKLIVTGSSSIDLANKVIEPLTGRSIEFHLYPVSLQELSQNITSLELDRTIDSILIYGSYPEVLSLDNTNKTQLLINIASNYLYKDILKFQEIKKPDLIHNILQALAYQVGQEVSLNELANRFEVDKNTIKRYLELLEKAFIIFRLRPLAQKRRSEVGKFRKFYFYDLGIRNAIIGNFSALNVRDDVGALWENFCIVERLKQNQYSKKYPNYYFWRNYEGSEIDLIEEWAGNLKAVELKFGSKKNFKIPQAFAKSYPNHTFEVIKKDNYLQLLQ